MERAKSLLSLCNRSYTSMYDNYMCKGYKSKKETRVSSQGPAYQLLPHGSYCAPHPFSGFHFGDGVFSLRRALTGVGVRAGIELGTC
jgi:hypothetical protein